MGQSHVRHKAQSTPRKPPSLGEGVLEEGVGAVGMQTRAGRGWWEQACPSGCSAEQGSSRALRIRREERAGGATQVPGRGAERGHAA